MADDSQKTTPKDAVTKVFDVARPGKSPATATSRPVIVGHKPQVHDPLLSPTTEQSLLTHTKKKTVVAPAASAPISAIPDDATGATQVSAPVDASVPATEDALAADLPSSLVTPSAPSISASPAKADMTEADTKPATIAAASASSTPSQSAPTPDATSARELGDAAALPLTEQPLGAKPVLPAPVAAPASTLVSVAPPTFPGMPEVAPAEPSTAANAVQNHPADLPDVPSPLPSGAASSSTISGSDQIAPAPASKLMAETPAPFAQPGPGLNTQASQVSPPAPATAQTSSASGFDELDLSQVSKPTFTTKQATSSPSESESDEALLAGMSNAPLIEPSSIVVSHHKPSRGFKKRAYPTAGGPQVPLLTAHSASRKRHFPWIGLLLTLLVLVLIAVIVLDLLLDGGFISDVFRGRTLPHTHFFKT